MHRFAVSLAKGDVARFAAPRENAQWKRISDVCGRDAAVPRRLQRADAKFWSADPKYRLAARSDDVANLWLPACQCIEEFVSRCDLLAGIARIGSSSGLKQNISRPQSKENYHQTGGHDP